MLAASYPTLATFSRTDNGTQIIEATSMYKSLFVFLRGCSICYKEKGSMSKVSEKIITNKLLSLSDHDSWQSGYFISLFLIWEPNVITGCEVAPALCSMATHLVNERQHFSTLTESTPGLNQSPKKLVTGDYVRRNQKGDITQHHTDIQAMWWWVISPS